MPQSTRPNILLLLSDQHAADIAGFAGDRRVRTPTLDALAASSDRFEQAYCASPVCTPSRMCLLTGKEPYRCAAWGNHWVIFPEHVTWPGHFARHGYATGLVGKMHFGGRDQMQGFQSRPYGDLRHGLGHQPEPLSLFPGYKAQESAGVSEIPESLNHDAVVTRETLALIAEQRDSRPDQPWFVCASYTRPHPPYTAPARFFRRYEGKLKAETLPSDPSGYEPYVAGVRGRSAMQRSTQEGNDRGLQGYYACVDYLDECLGDLLDGLRRTGALRNTIVIYTTDHGEMGGRHGLFGKSVYFEESIRVPLLLRLPGRARGRVLSQPVSLLDLFPTACGLAGLPVPRGLDGIDLSSALRARSPRAWPRKSVSSMLCAYGAKITYAGAVADTAPNSAFRSIRMGDWKYVAIQGGAPLLFNLAKDPKERNNLAALPAQAKRLKRMDAVAFRGFSWGEVRRRLRRDRRRIGAFASGLKPTTPNQYRLPDGRTFDAESALYEARWLALPPNLNGGIIPQQFG